MGNNRKENNTLFMNSNVLHSNSYKNKWITKSSICYGDNNDTLLSTFSDYPCVYGVSRALHL